MMRVLITGSTGFVGSNLVPYLIAKEIEVFTLDRTKNNTTGIKKASIWSEVDDLDCDQVDAIVHLTGRSHDVKNTSDAQSYYNINVELTKTLISATQRNGFAGKFIYFSSVKAVADHVTYELREDSPANPKTPYGLSKLKAEQFLLSIFDKNQDNLYILRPCMIHGPNNKGNLNLLYYFVMRGIPYPLDSFQNQRSLLSVENLCFIIYQFLFQKAPGGTYHVADDGSISTSDIVSVMGQVTGKVVRKWKLPKSLIQLTAKVGDFLPSPLNSDRLQKLTENYVVNTSKLKEVLNMPLPMTLEEGLCTTVKSFGGGPF